jgi:AraC family transcriptional regulator
MYIPRDHLADSLGIDRICELVALQLELRISRNNRAPERRFFVANSTSPTSAYGAQMAKYFTMNQPPHVAIDSLDSVVRPEMAVTRLIARSGIPERTASIPSEKAYVVSVHLNPAGKGEWELWTDGTHIKTGPWPTGGVAMCDLESDSSIRNPGAIDWVHFHVPRATLDALTDDEEIPRVKRLHCIYGTPDPTLYHLTQSIVPCLKTPEMFSRLFMDHFVLVITSHLVGQYGQARGPARRFAGGLSPWQKRRVVELIHEHLDGEVKLAKLAQECRLSVSHFARSFKKSFGISAHRYLTLQRVEVAKELLSQSRNSLSEIAALAGFSDQAALSRTFASVAGAPPGRWKRENVGDTQLIEGRTEELDQAFDR